ncbi:hypothetical protein LTR53_015552 [Teratosphaeriaceae sp. CCFEE 6253]|nr:hypothetical protein LTR53_015552 [Teratosphaeriaceae sp. CCFEE 6253]
MEASPLLLLPPEMRNHIYELALHHPKPVMIDKFAGDIPEGERMLYARFPGPDKCSTMYYHNNTFEFWPKADVEIKSMLSAFLTSIGQRNASAVRAINVDLGTYGTLRNALLRHRIIQLIRFAKMQPHITFLCKAFIDIVRGISHWQLRLHVDDVSGGLERLREEQLERLEGEVDGTVEWVDTKWVADEIERALPFWRELKM